VEPGDAPVVRYQHDDVRHQLRCRLLIGADKRMSTVRRQLGLALRQSEQLSPQDRRIED
jgi:2-polyprenyl-6-methoxyphenol hydroxylase-like FAD-dependent oxidoreductase